MQGARGHSPGRLRDAFPRNSFQVPDEGRIAPAAASACGPKRTSCPRRQLRSVLRARPPPHPTSASKPREANHIGRWDLERFHPWGKGAFFSFSRCERDHNLTLECHPSARTMAMSPP